MAIRKVKKKIPVDKLEIGMFVVELDRPWLETDFLLQGFIIQDQDDVHALQRQCEFVYIQGEVIEKSDPKERREQRVGLFARIAGKKKQPEAAPTKTSKIQGISSAPPAEKDRVKYINKISMEQEFKAATNTYSSAKNVAKNIMDGIRIGMTLDINQARETVDSIVDSILRNNNALVWLSKLRNKDEYTSEHSLNVCILSVTFARHLGHDEDEIRKIGLGGLLHDIGKAKIPMEVLNKPGRLTDEEFQLMKNHPTYGRQLLMSMPRSELFTLDVAYSHHERIDGQGYPRQLQAHQIPYYAKVVSLADTYDAITSNRIYDSGRASMEALDIIFKNRGKQFDRELAAEFIKCIGVYPPGSIVELTNGEVGIVIASNPGNKLRPRILLVKNSEKEWRKAQKVIDLAKRDLDPDKNPYMIAKEIPNGTHGVDIRKFIADGLVLKYDRGATGSTP